MVPATANILAKFANGIADDLVSSAGVARTAPTAVCPSMNVNMWLNPATQRNISQLKEDGVHVWGPAAGDLACGVKGTGRLIEPGEIVERAAALLTPKVLAGKKAVVTAGPTQEAIDPVRCLTNHSSGRQGYAVARALAAAGADVTLISGPTALAAPVGVARIDVASADDMYREAMKAAETADLFVGAAAVADWRAETVAVKAAFPDITAVGFAAETENVEAVAKAKLAAKHLDAVIGNNGPAAFGRDVNAVVIVTAKGVRIVDTTTKERIAGEIVTEIVGLLKEKTHA